MSDSFVTPWTVAFHGPLTMGFPRQEYWSELLCPPQGDLPDPEMEPASPALAEELFTTKPPGKRQAGYVKGKRISRGKSPGYGSVGDH